MGYRAIVTCDQDSKELTLEELRRIGGALSSYEWLDPGDTVQGGMLLVEQALPFAEFSRQVDSSIFIWHLAPVDAEIELTSAENDLDHVATAVKALIPRIDPSLSFSVQTRILGTGKLPYRKVVVNETVSNVVVDEIGGRLDCRWPRQVISILCTPTTAYLGLSLVEQNRSAWAGGQHRLKAEDDQISRSEFKLEESLSVFNLTLPSSGHALDIGAAPGGWSRILSRMGLAVDAVDPADLDGRLRGQQVRHIRKRIQEYQPGDKKFEVIANDMKMDARESVEIMLRFASHLSGEGYGLITLKMPKFDDTASESRKVLDMLRMNLERLETEFAVLGVRQLFHNRSEVTVLLGKKR